MKKSVGYFYDVTDFVQNKPEYFDINGFEVIEPVIMNSMDEDVLNTNTLMFTLENKSRYMDRELYTYPTILYMLLTKMNNILDLKNKNFTYIFKLTFTTNFIYLMYRHNKWFTFKHHSREDFILTHVFGSALCEVKILHNS